MMWTINLDHGISLGTYHGVTLMPDASLWQFPPAAFMFYMEEARELMPWVYAFQLAHWCYQGGKTDEEIYQAATTQLATNALSASLLAVFQDCLTAKQRKPTHLENQQSTTRPGCVYLLKGERYYKIGLSSNVNRRMEEISPRLPFETELICTIATEDMHGLEAQLHELYAGKRANGEWFKLSDEDVAYIKELADGQ